MSVYIYIIQVTVERFIWCRRHNKIYCLVTKNKIKIQPNTYSKLLRNIRNVQELDSL